MGTNLSKDSGVALLINAFSTIFALALLILIIAPISGAHFNPAVSLVQVIRREMNAVEFLSLERLFNLELEDLLLSLVLDISRTI